jgi:hypothetical protein
MLLRPLATAVLLTAAVPAAAWDGDPSMTCRDALNQSDGIAPAVDWVAGYIAGRTRIAIPANRMSIDTAIAAACVADRQRPLAEVAEEIAVAALAKLPFIAPGTAEGATAMLRAFYDPTADHWTLTGALRPTDAEIGLIYNEPLATPLRYYVAVSVYGEGDSIEPGADDVDVEVNLTTTDALKADGAAASGFPADYDRVLAHLRPGLPIATFRFFAEGPGPGKAFDGLVHVNGHWVLLPEPWRVLDDDGGGR